MSAVVELTRALVAANTINPPGNEAAAAEVAGARLEAAGFEVAVHELAPGRPNLVARWPGRSDRPALGLCAHLDVVPLGEAQWTRDPFAGEIDGDRLYGRGTSDMKGGAAAIVVAAERVARLGRGEAGLEVVLCAGEETGCDGALALAGAGRPAGSGPPAGGGHSPLGHVGALLVAEPTSNHPCVAHKGVAWLQAVAAGQTAHGSMPHLGDNALYKLARAIGVLETFVFDVASHPLLGEPTLSVGTAAAGININSVPARAVAGIDVRTIPGLTADLVATRLREALGPDITVETTLDLAPIDTDPADPWVADVYEVMEPHLGERPAPRGLAYFTDAAALTPAYGNPPTIICGPGDAAQAHRTDESCSVAKLEAAAEGFFEVARRWCGL